MADVQQQSQQRTQATSANATATSANAMASPPMRRMPFSTQDFLDEIVRVRRSKRRRTVLIVILVLLIAAIVVAAVVLRLPGSLYTVSSNDMKPALEQGQTVLNRQQDSYAKNDIVLFKSSTGDVKVKRVLAKSGEWVNVANDGTVTISAKSLETPSTTNTTGSGSSSASGSTSNSGTASGTSASSSSSTSASSGSSSASSGASSSGSTSASSASSNSNAGSSAGSASSSTSGSTNSRSGSGIIASRQVPSGYYYLAADSTATTLDVLSQSDSFVDTSQVIGKVTFSVWPLTKFGPVQ